MSRFLIACGGTGGHLSPGIALAEGLNARGHETSLLISRKKVDARLIEKYPHLHFERIPGAPFTLHPVGLARCLWQQVAAFWFSARLIRRWRPDLIAGFGGFTTAGIIVVAALFRRPVALHEANRVPGRAIRLLGGLARRLYLPPGVTMRGVRLAGVRHVGLPVRREIVRLPREAAQVRLGLDPAQKVLVILGGSQGASPLNDWVRGRLERLAAEGIQVYCVTGLGKGGDEARELQIEGRPAGPGGLHAVLRRRGHAALGGGSRRVARRRGHDRGAHPLRDAGHPRAVSPGGRRPPAGQRAFFEQQGGGIVVDEQYLADLHREVLDVIFNDWLLRKFRGNLQRMDQANSLDLMLDDLESLAAPRAAGSAPRRPGSLSPAASRKEAA